MALRCSLRQALKASMLEATESPYKGHRIPEDFGHSDNSQEYVAPVKRTRSSNSTSKGKTNVANGVTAGISRRKGENRILRTEKKRKASKRVDHSATAKAKRPRIAEEGVPAVKRAKGTSCAECRRGKRRCMHTSPAGEGSQSRDAATTVCKAMDRGKKAVAGQEELLEDTIEVSQAESFNEPNPLDGTPSSGQAWDLLSPPLSGDVAISAIPPSSVSATRNGPGAVSALEISDLEDLSHISAEDAEYSALSSVLSSRLFSNEVDVGASHEAVLVPHTVEGNNAADKPRGPDPIVTRYEDQNESSLAAGMKRSAAVQKSWIKRRHTAVEAVEPTAATETTKSPEATPKQAPRRDVSIKKASSSRRTRVVTFPIPKTISFGPSGSRSSRKNKVMTTLSPSTTQQESGLLITESLQPERALPEQVLHTDPALTQLSQKLMAREPLTSKPETRGQPLVWADSRQALCETVPYFKKPQGGCHQNDRHVYAFLLDGVGHSREYMDSDVIISRAGGHMEPDSSGKMVQKNSVLMSEAQVQAVLNDIDLQNPLVIICGDRNEGAVCKMPHKYNVLGWYKPVAVWAEKTLGKPGKTWTTIKYRFERLCDSRPSWHQPVEQLVTDEDRQLAGNIAQTTRACFHCSRSFPKVYLCGWLCLNSDCVQFWRLESGQDAPYGKLLYNPAFLLDRTRWTNEEEPYSVQPTVPSVGNLVGDNLTYINTRGICCPQCGRCTSRRLFKGWRCDNPSCSFQSFPQHIPVTPPMLHNPWENSGDGPALARNKHEAEKGVKVKVTHAHGFKVFTYTFEGVNGTFVHAVSNAKINRELRGPDEMFAAIQRQNEPGMDMHLERRRFGIEKMPVNKLGIPTTGPTFATEIPVIPLRQSTSDTRPDSSPLSVLGSTPSPPDYRQTVASCNEGQHDEIESATQIVPDAAAEATGDSGDTFLPGIEEAVGAGVAQIDASKDTTNASKPVVGDGDLMTAFSINYGMPYKFIAVGESLPFTDSPWPVRTCRADLNWASQTFLDPTDHTDFNEELIFAYLEGQKIEYHDDGESGLGPRIATLSLGGKAKMHLRMKGKHYVGCSKQGIFTAEKPMPHSIGGPEMYQKRLAAWNELQQLRTTDKSAYERRRKEVPKELRLDDKKTKKAEDLVTVTLNHGDIVLMEGHEIQQYLEHKIVPEQCLRFALTCRTVLPEHLKPEERPVYEVEPDDEAMSCLRAMVARDGCG